MNYVIVIYSLGGVDPFIRQNQSTYNVCSTPFHRSYSIRLAGELLHQARLVVIFNEKITVGLYFGQSPLINCLFGMRPNNDVMCSW
jgi:hypothetical protein